MSLSKIHFTTILFYMFIHITITTISGQAIDSSLTLQIVNGSIVPFQINGGSVPSQTFVPYHDFQKQTSRTHIPLATGWKKQRQNLDHTLSLKKRDAGVIAQIETEAGGKHTTGYNDAAWQNITIPANENTMPSYENLAGVEVYEGGVWYRKTFTVTPSWNGNKYITLNFIGVGYIADVWLNGIYLGFHEGGYTPFLFDVSSKLNYTGNNYLVVRVDVIPWGGALAENNVTLPFQKVDWFNQWGIYREVFLMIEEKNHIVRSDIKTTDNTGNISVKTVIHNNDNSNKNLTAIIDIYKANFSGKENLDQVDASVITTPIISSSSVNISVNATSVVSRTDNFTIPNPEYWYPSKTDAHLYILKVTLKEGATILDEYYTQFGLRTLDTKCSKIILNGEAAPFLVGVGRHEESPTNGRAMTNAEIYNDITVIQNNLHANLIRGHYAFNPITYKYQDRLGVVAYAEIPVYWYHNAVDYTRMNSRTIRDQMWREMIYANYNSPSIWFWSTQNESEAWTNLIAHNQHLKNEADKIDGTRIVIQSGVGKNTTDPSHGPLKAVGLTMYYGSFHGTPGDFYGGTKWALEQYHANNPDKPILDTEFGMWSEPNNSNGAHQLYVFQETFNAYKLYATRTETGQINSNGFVAGCTWWAAFNWYTSHNTLVASMGVYSMNRTSTKPITSVLANEFIKYSSLTPSATEYDMIYDVPGKIQAEDYRYICPGSGYNDFTTGNTGTQYRLDDVDIEATTDAGGGYNVGWAQAGEWLEYTTNVTSTGIYSFDLRVASAANGKKIHLEIDGVNVSGSITIPNTGGWQNYQNVVINNISLTTGKHIVRIVYETDGVNFNYINTTLVTPLPISLLYFKGEHKKDHNLLWWQTSFEKNSSSIEIQKSEDGSMFHKIGTIAAQINSTNLVKYEFIDLNASSSNYYRLKLIDLNGEFNYSTIIYISNYEESRFEIYPNPVIKAKPITCKVSSLLNSTVEISLFNSLGQVIFSKITNIIAGDNELIVPTDSMPSGLYILKAATQNDSFMQRLIIE